jgi:hypothetical protein
VLAALAYLTLAAFLPFTPPMDPERLTEGFPQGLPSEETLARWEQIWGEGGSDELKVVYRFYIDPARPALYRITQYRVTRSQADSAPVSDTEKLIWNAEPGSRAPLQCFERVRTPGQAWQWRRLEPDSHRYRIEMSTAMAIYRLHRSRLGL